MYIKWSPQRNENTRIVYQQPNKDILKINTDEELDFSSEFIVEFDVSKIEQVISAYKKDGNLYLELLYFYNQSDRKIWENKKELDYVDYIELELLLP